jgi:hypothetical protein
MMIFLASNYGVASTTELYLEDLLGEEIRPHLRVLEGRTPHRTPQRERASAFALTLVR